MENALAEHPPVAEVAMIGLPDPRCGEVIACFIRAELDVRDLHYRCRAHLSPLRTPAVCCRVDAFPLTRSRKTGKFWLRDGCLAGAHRALSSTP